MAADNSRHINDGSSHVLSISLPLIRHSARAFSDLDQRASSVETQLAPPPHPSGEARQAPAELNAWRAVRGRQRQIRSQQRLSSHTGRR
eukprot:6190637-Pleurochrysis_carterae.AAC.3